MQNSDWLAAFLRKWRGRCRSGSGAKRNWSGSLAEQQVEAGRLQSQIETTKARPNSEIPRAPTATPANKLPFLLELIHNRAVPFDKNNYRAKLNLTGPTIVQRRKEAETLAEIRQPDSEFNKMVQKLNPDKQLVSCLVNAFRQFCAELLCWRWLAG